MILNYLEVLLDKVKTFINNFNMLDKTKIILILVWLFCISVMVFTKVGIAILTVLACICYVFFITHIMYSIYKNIERNDSIEDFVQVSKNKEQARCARKTYGPVRKVNEKEFSGFIKCETEHGYYPYYEKASECSARPTYYFLDTSVFFAIQEYTAKRGLCISDIVYGNIPINDNFNCLAEIIRSRRGYVTIEILEEIKNAENQKKLQRGVVDFVEEDIGIWKSSEKYPGNDNLIVPTYNEFDKTPRLKHHKLVWNAVMLSKNKDCDVTIITSSQRIFSLAKANQVKVVEPNKIEQEE